MVEESKSIFLKSWENIDFKLKIEPKGSSNKTRVEFNILNPKSGKNERVKKSSNLSGWKTEKQIVKAANVLVDDLIDLLSTGWSPFTGSIQKVSLTKNSNIGDCLAEYNAYRKGKYDNKAITKNRYITSNIAVKHFSNWINENGYQFRKPSSFTLIDMTNFFDSASSKNNWSKETFNTYRSDIKSFWIYLKELRVVDNYDFIAKIPHKNTRKDSSMYKIYTEEELEIINKILANDPAYKSLYLVSKLLYYYNIRLEEQLKLQIKDYNPKTKLLTIPPNKTKNGDEAVFELDSDTAELLEVTIADYPAEYYFINLNNRPRQVRLAYGAIGQRWRKLRKKYNISDSLKFYALKHSSSFYALADGESLPALQQRLRHILESTTRRYTGKLNQNIIKPSSNKRF
jgi:integrase